MKRMKSGKAGGSDNIAVQVWKCLGERAVDFLPGCFTQSRKVRECLRNGDIQICRVNR